MLAGDLRTHKMTKYQIHKIDAARRQIEIAITLFFYERDFVSIHTLAAAGHNIIVDVAKQKRITVKSIADIGLSLVKEEHKKQYVKKIRESENFFKHADKDADGILEFNPELTEFFLWNAVNNYRSITGEMPPIFDVFDLWFMVTHPTAFVFPPEKKQLQQDAYSELQDFAKKGIFRGILTHNASA